MLTHLKDRAAALDKNLNRFKGIETPRFEPDTQPVRVLGGGAGRFRMPVLPDFQGALHNMYTDIQRFTEELKTTPTPEPGPEQFNKVGLRLAALARKCFGAAGIDPSWYPSAQQYGFRPLIERAGFTWLGNGYFSVVVSHPEFPGLAFKMGLKKEDSGAMYAMWCRANPGPHIPEIKFTARYPEMYLVVLPLYKEYCGGADAELDFQYKMASSALYKPMVEAEIDTVDRLGLGSIARAASAIGWYFDGLAQLDLHRGNVMIKKGRGGRHELIITDPVSMREHAPVQVNEDRSLPVVL